VEGRSRFTRHASHRVGISDVSQPRIRYGAGPRHSGESQSPARRSRNTGAPTPSFRGKPESSQTISQHWPPNPRHSGEGQIPARRSRNTGPKTTSFRRKPESSQMISQHRPPNHVIPAKAGIQPDDLRTPAPQPGHSGESRNPVRPCHSTSPTKSDYDSQSIPTCRDFRTSNAVPTHRDYRWPGEGSPSVEANRHILDSPDESGPE
jgi:hypothetical protein